MSEEIAHSMILVTTHPSGTDEWYCPTCGRRVLMTWPPDYKKVVLESGDESVAHNGGKGGVVMQGAALNAAEPASDPGATHLRPFLDWFEKVDFAAYWDKPA